MSTTTTAPDRRMTATPAFKMTVWVERIDGEMRTWLRPNQTTPNKDAAHLDGWIRLTRQQWAEVKDCVDRYFEVLDPRS